MTVLFADLVGFTAQAESLDPEDVSALLSPYFIQVREELERFGGTVEKFIGDAVMAVFGAPIAHEDDPERAVRAAIAIRDRVAAAGGQLQLRLGVNTGQALVTLDREAAREGQGIAKGDVVNTAARLQAAAPVNGILVGEATYRATSAAIEYRDATEIVAKGKAEPVKVWQAVRTVPREGTDLLHAGAAPLIGRTRELKLLLDSLEEVRRERQARLVSVVGVPGIGKSRLVREFFEQARQDAGAKTRWLRGRSLPYGAEATLWALAEMVKAQAGILETDDPELGEAKLLEAVGQLISDGSDSRWIADHLRPLAGLDSGFELARTDRGEAFTAWRRFFEGLAHQGPLVLVFEDIHWADETLLDFIEQLVLTATAVPMLILCTARPELLDSRSAWGTSSASAATVTLSPLSDDETSSLVANLLDELVIPASTHEALVSRSGGNPLYTEQYVRMLAEQTEERDLPLPGTVQGIIAARLDGLPPDEKGLLQTAAVVGKVFWLGAVLAVDGITQEAAQVSLRSLDRKGYVRRARQSSVADEPEFSFLHILVRDVAYGQIPRTKKATKHRLVADWIDSLGRAHDHAEMLAFHYLSAIEPDRATGKAIAGSDSARAQKYLLLAADRAERLYANDEAIAHLRAAMGLGETTGSTDERRQLVLRCARLEDTRGSFDAAVRLYDQALQEEDDLVAALGRVGTLRKIGEYRQCLDSIDQIKARHPTVTPEQSAAIALEEGLVLSHTGDLHPAIAALTAGLDAVAGRGLRLEGELLVSLARIEELVRRYDYAEAHAERARALFEEQEDLPGLTRALRVLGAVVAAAPGATQRRADSKPSTPDQWLRSRQILEQALALARRVGDAEEEGASLTNLAGTLWMLGSTEDALRCDRESLAAFEKVGLRAGVAAALANLASHLGLLGRWDECKAAATQQLAVAREIGHKIWTMRALLALADAALALDELAEAAAAAEEAAELALSLDDRVRARAALETAEEAHTRLGDSEHARALKARRGDLRDEPEKERPTSNSDALPL